MAIPLNPSLDDHTLGCEEELTGHITISNHTHGVSRVGPEHGNN